jgi:dTDP-4-amino-4,6-dideoxygalactose transaminase
MALGIGSGDEVLCPTYTFFATAGCVARAGATPVFVDADAKTFNIDVKDAEGKVTPKTKAIIPVHLFGQCAEMDGVMALAKKHNLAVIEDAAQSLGATFNGKAAGSIGDFGTYSFFPSKNLGGLGDGGLLASNDDALADKARLLRTHGSRPKYYHKVIGGNFRLDSLQAAFLRVKLPHYGKYTESRKSNAAYYTEKLSKISGVVLASEYSPGSKAKVVLPVAQSYAGHIWNQYTLRVPGAGKRDNLRQTLSKAGIGNEIYYPVPMHQQECFAYCDALNSCPMATELSGEAISIPIYPELTREQLDEVVGKIKDWAA